MLPIGTLMMEHRLIERMIYIIKNELKVIQEEKNVNPIFIDNIVDFLRTYADKTHHGKEEDILFRELKKKNLSNDHSKIMKELIEDHKFARKTTSELLNYKEKFIQGEENAIDMIIEKIKTLVDFYPNHIEKEDKHFFIPIMNYFSEEEQNEILNEGQRFDRRMIHRKYDNLVQNFEKGRNLFKEKEIDWINML